MSAVTYNFKNVIYDYQQYMQGKDDEDFQEQKEMLADKAMKVIAIGVGRFTECQEQFLIEVSERNSSLNPEDRVIQLICALAKYIVFTRQLKVSIPEEVRFKITLIASCEDIPYLNSLTTVMKNRVASHVADQILGLQNVPTPGYFNLLQATKVVAVHWKEMTKYHESIVNKLRSLKLQLPIENPDTDIHSSAKHFVELANALIQQHDIKNVPHEAATHPAYHGEALQYGFSKLQEKLKETGASDGYSLQAFTLDYCDNFLENNQYLIRNSSTAPSQQVKGIKSYTVTMSRKTPEGTLESLRITYEMNVEKKEITWKALDENNQIVSLEKLTAMLNRCVPGYTPCYAASRTAVEKFVTGYVHRPK